MRIVFSTLYFVFILVSSSFSQNSLPRIKVSDNQRFLVKEDGKPFFWMADTAWELFHRCDDEEVEYYLNKRAEQGFNVIQAVALAEIDGLNSPNAFGETPLFENDPKQPNPRYFDNIAKVLKEAEAKGLYIALLPTWGDKVFKKGWGVGPEVFNVDNAEVFGRWMGQRFKDFTNLIWVIGGDRNPRENSTDVELWRAMAKGIASGTGGIENTLMTFHPQPSAPGGSSNWFHNDEWLDFNMHQTGHCPTQATYKKINHDYNLAPIKPTIDGEPLYEDHPNCFKPEELGHSIPEDIRRIMYWNVFAGAFGQSYGCHAVWQMFTAEREGINLPLRPWQVALDLPMATQVQHLKNLMLSRPYLTRVPDQLMVVDTQVDDESYVIATRDQEGSYAMIYIPTGKEVTLNTSILKSKTLKCSWYDPRTGAWFDAGIVSSSPSFTYTAPSTGGKGHDWVMVLDAM